MNYKTNKVKEGVERGKTGYELGGGGYFFKKISGGGIFTPFYPVLPPLLEL